MIKGIFITCEGPECGGKSGMIPLLADHLRSRGYTVTTTREPGGSELAEKLRSLILSDRAINPMTELLLFAAGRSDHIQHTILPALKAGHVVISDRFADSSYAYQGKARGQVEQVLAVEKMVLGDFQPDYTLFFDIPLEESRRRLALRSAASDRIEKEGDAFHLLTFEGYQERFLAHPARMQRIDALPAKEEVAKQVIAWANARFENLS